MSTDAETIRMEALKLACQTADGPPHMILKAARDYAHFVMDVVPPIVPETAACSSGNGSGEVGIDTLR